MENYIIAKATDVGRTRQVNEDSMTVFNSPNGQVMVVCDGMGGQAAGDVASQLSVSIIESILTDNTFETPEEAIRRSVMAANQGVLNRTAQNPEQEGMGSTCVMLIISNGKVHCGWIGDSRIYYIANHTIRQISHDQSYVQQLVDSGQITAAEAANHPQKNEITNCIGLPGMTAPETIPMPITPEPGSVFLLCSDGLSGPVGERQIERVVSNERMTLQEKANRLIELANEAGGPDNITVELVQFQSTDNINGKPSNIEVAHNTTHQKKSHALLYSLLGVVAVGVIGAGIYIFASGQEKNTEEKKEVVHHPEPVQPKPTAPETPATDMKSTTGTTTTTTTTVVVTKPTPKPEPVPKKPEKIIKEDKKDSKNQKEQNVQDVKKTIDNKGDNPVINPTEVPTINAQDLLDKN